MSRFVLVVALLISTAVVTVAAAQSAPSATIADDEIAKGLFHAGKAAFAAGRYKEAYDRFFEAYAHSPRSALLYNLAVSLDRLRRDDEALRHYRGYLADVPDAENRDEVENRIKALEAAAEEKKSESVLLAAPTLTIRPAPAPTRTGDIDAPSAAEPIDRDGSVFGEWWFWTAAGLVVTGVVVSVVVASDGDDVAKPRPGSNGMIVIALTSL